MRVPSPQEKVQAILDARMPLYEYLVSIGKADVFASFTKDEICGMIRATQEAVQKSLHEQAANTWGKPGGGPIMDDEIPFAAETR